MKVTVFFVLLLSVLTSGCRSITPKQEESHHHAGAPSVGANAYSLLYELLNDEKNVSKLLLVKRDSRELNRLAKDISNATGKAADQLKKFAEQDVSLELNAINLPPGEVATRKAIAATKKQELLRNSGDEFERSFLLTQVEALNYAAHLTLVAANNDANTRRSTWSQSLHQEMKALHSRCVEMLSRSSHGR